MLELRSPSNGTGWAERWSFSGADERLLRDCLQQLGDFATEPPLEVYDRRTLKHVIRSGDRWHAAMLVWPNEPTAPHHTFKDIQADQAWTADGALRLAELLPERLSELRDAIRARFSAS